MLKFFIIIVSFIFTSFRSNSCTRFCCGSNGKLGISYIPRDGAVVRSQNKFSFQSAASGSCSCAWACASGTV